MNDKTIDLGPKVKISQELERTLEENEIDIVAVQETHTENSLQLQSRL